MNPSASLYVGDLHPDVNEPQLHEVFRVIGNIQSIRLCRDAFTRRSLGYAYVNFYQVEDAERALEALNYTPLKDRPMRIMWSHRDPSIRRSGVGNVYIKNLHPEIDNKALYDTFSAFGNILSCKVAGDDIGKSRGFGFVHFETQEAADRAIEHVNGKELLGQCVYVAMWKSRRERMKQSQERFTNLFIKNMPTTWSEEDLQTKFNAYGKVTSAVVMKNEKGESKGFGFVNFETSDMAKKAAEALNGKEEDGKALYVSRAQKKAERKAELQQRYLQMQRDKQYSGVNLYVKNLDEEIDETALYAAFSPYGTITSHTVMRDPTTNVSKGFGFVCFATPEEATRAVTEMNSRMLGSKPLYVALAQKKEVRRQQLEAQRAQRAALGPMGVMQPQTMPAPPNMYPNMYFPQGPVPGPQQYPGFGPVMRPAGGRWVSGPGVVPTADGFQPHVAAGNFIQQPQQQQQSRGGARQRGGRPGGQGGQGGRGGRAAYKLSHNARNRDQVPMQAGGAIPPQGYGMQQPMMYANANEQDLSTVLVSSTPEERRMILGEKLYPLVEAACAEKAEFAPKVTGMLLQMDPTEILVLLESQSDLDSRVQEAINLIMQAQQQQLGGETPGGDAAKEAITAE